MLVPDLPDNGGQISDNIVAQARPAIPAHILDGRASDWESSAWLKLYHPDPQELYHPGPQLIWMGERLSRRSRGVLDCFQHVPLRRNINMEETTYARSSRWQSGAMTPVLREYLSILITLL
jgi:hypothetical protein